MDQQKNDGKTDRETMTIDLTEKQTQMLAGADQRVGQARNHLQTVIATILAGEDIDGGEVVNFDGAERKLTVALPEDND